MKAPPYSPTVPGDDTRVSHEYTAEDRGLREEDVLSHLRRERPSSPTTVQASASITGLPENTYNILSPQPTPLASLLDLPPTYAPTDHLARSFSLSAPLIYATKTSTLPRYHLAQNFTASGRPCKLHIRRLLPTESRSLSSTSQFHSSDARSLSPSYSDSSSRSRLVFDTDTTHYTATIQDLAGKYHRSVTMRGQRSSTLPGVVEFKTSRSVKGTSLKIYHKTRNKTKDALRPENEARIMKHGYHAEEEWDRRVLFCVRKGIWVSGGGREIAREAMQDGDIDIVDGKTAEGWRKDLVVCCWVVRVWMEQGMRWDGEDKGRSF